MKELHFPAEPAGALFTYTEQFPLTADNINWVGPAKGRLAVQGHLHCGLVAATANRLEAAWLKDLDGLTFEYPFGNFAKLSSSSPHIAMLFSDMRCRQSTYHDLLKLRIVRNLRWLNLARGDIGDEALPHLTHLEELRSLNLSQTRLTDNGLREIMHLGELIELDLSSTHVSNDGIKILQHFFYQLKVLNLADTQISDESVGSLIRMPSLRRLNVSKTNISPSLVDSLSHELPGCAVEVSGQWN